MIWQRPVRSVVQVPLPEAPALQDPVIVTPPRVVWLPSCAAIVTVAVHPDLVDAEAPSRSAMCTVAADGAGAMEMEHAAVAVKAVPAVESVAIAVYPNAPAVVGVPAIKPEVAANVNPGGSDPEIMEKA